MLDKEELDGPIEQPPAALLPISVIDVHTVSHLETAQRTTDGFRMALRAFLELQDFRLPEFDYEPHEFHAAKPLHLDAGLALFRCAVRKEVGRLALEADAVLESLDAVVAVVQGRGLDRQAFGYAGKEGALLAGIDKQHEPLGDNGWLENVRLELMCL